MPKITPKQIFPNIITLDVGGTVPTFGIFIPVSDIPGLTPDEADPYHGDYGKILHGLNKKTATAIAAMDAAVRSSKFSVTRGTPTGVNSTTIRQTYTATFDLDTSDVDVVSE